MYQILTTELNGKQVYTIKHIETGNYVSVIAGYGGTINEFVVNGREILLAAKTPVDFERVTQNKFAGNQLFPYPNRVNKANYTQNSVRFSLPANDGDGRPHALHGLIYNVPFTANAIDEAEGKLELSYQFDSLPGVYAHAFHLNVTYHLKVNRLIVTSSIKNLGDTHAPMGYGWHPYIGVTGNINDCKLQFDATDYYIVDDCLIPNGLTEKFEDFITAKTIGDVQLNHCLAIPLTGRYVTKLVDANYEITLEQHGYNYVQYYIPPDRKSIAIEPQTCIPDALNNGIGLIILQPGEKIELSFELSATKLTDNGRS